MKRLGSITQQIHLLFSALALYAHDYLFYWMAKRGMVLGANTLTSLIPSLYASLEVVSRELTGMIPGMTLDATTTRAAVGQPVLVFTTPTAAATAITPGVTPPDDGDQAIGNVSVTITKARRVPFRWNGEEEVGLNNNGAGAAAIKTNQITQALRTLVNEIEVDALLACYVGASRAYGTATQTPFASTLADPAQVRKILDDNGAPQTGRSMVIDTTAGANLRTLGQLTKANEAGTIMTLRDGALLDLHGFTIRESAQVPSPAIGTSNGSWTTDTAGYAIGATAIGMTGGSGTVIAGDIVTFAGDTNKYVVETALTAGVLTLAKPGLRKAIAASNVALTTIALSPRNVAYTQDSMVLATRAPALPANGDLAVDRTNIVDPRTGLSFEVAMYPQYRQMQYEISIVWGCKNIKSAHTAILLG